MRALPLIISVAVGLTLAGLSTAVALADDATDDPTATVTLTINVAPSSVPTTLTVEVQRAPSTTPPLVKLRSDAAVAARSTVRAEVETGPGASSVTMVPIHATLPLDWQPVASSPQAPANVGAGCGPHPAPNTPGCERLVGDDAPKRVTAAPEPAPAVPADVVAVIQPAPRAVAATDPARNPENLRPTQLPTAGGAGPAPVSPPLLAMVGLALIGAGFSLCRGGLASIPVVGGRSHGKRPQHRSNRRREHGAALADGALAASFDDRVRVVRHGVPTRRRWTTRWSARVIVHARRVHGLVVVRPADWLQRRVRQSILCVRVGSWPSTSSVWLSQAIARGHTSAMPWLGSLSRVVVLTASVWRWTAHRSRVGSCGALAVSLARLLQLTGARHDPHRTAQAHSRDERSTPPGGCAPLAFAAGRSTHREDDAIGRLERQLRADLTADQWRRCSALWDADRAARGSEQQRFIAELCRHFPGLTPTLRVVAAHSFAAPVALGAGRGSEGTLPYDVMRQRLRVDVTADQWRRCVALWDADRAARLSEQDRFVVELCRHFPGLAPAIRVVADHIIETPIAEQEACCAGAWMEVQDSS